MANGGPQVEPQVVERSFDIMLAFYEGGRQRFEARALVKLRNTCLAPLEAKWRHRSAARVLHLSTKRPSDKMKQQRGHVAPNG